MRERRMEIKTCGVRECGARVLMLDVEGRPFAVNPAGVQTVVPDQEGKMHLVEGYQPHVETCVDISARISPQPTGGG